MRVVHIRRMMVTKENMRKEDANTARGEGGGEDKGEERWRRMEEDGEGMKGRSGSGR